MFNRRDFSAAAWRVPLSLGFQHVGPPTTLEFVDAPAAPAGLARPDRMFRVTVCLRPFRAAGPRIEAEWIDTKYVVHNYGHGGSGWSLSSGAPHRRRCRSLCN